MKEIMGFPFNKFYFTIHIIYVGKNNQVLLVSCFPIFFFDFVDKDSSKMSRKFLRLNYFLNGSHS